MWKNQEEYDFNSDPDLSKVTWKSESARMPSAHDNSVTELSPPDEIKLIAAVKHSMSIFHGPLFPKMIHTFNLTKNRGTKEAVCV